MIVYGKNILHEYLKEKEKIKKVYLQEGFSDKNVIKAIEENKVNYEYKDKQYLEKLAKGVHQGIVLEVEEYKYIELDDLIKENKDFIVLLDHIEDPHNLGAIIRTCEAAKVDGIIIPKDRSVSVNGTVAKTSAATILNVPICQVTNLKQTLDALKKNGFWIVGCDMNGMNYRKIDYSGKIVVIIGNEGEGMHSLIKRNCDFIAGIPMYGDVNSLNASVSAGIMIYEVLRQKGK